MGLNGKTPSEIAGIKVEGENKWITLIQNASRRDRWKITFAPYVKKNRLV